MIMRGLLRKGALFGLLVGSLTGCAGICPSPSIADSAWWHLDSGARPTSLHAGSAKDEVQELDVQATGGSVMVIEPLSLEEEEKGVGSLKLTLFEYDAAPQAVQIALEEIYGAGNVQVSGGPGGPAGSNPYVITFTGGLADRALKHMNTEFSADVGLEGSATVKQVKGGAPDGQIVVTAANLGDSDAEGEAEVEGEKTPVKIVDRLPAGFNAVSAEAIAGQDGGGGIPSPVCSVQSQSLVSCEFTHKLPPYDQIEMKIGVVVGGDAISGESNEVGISGGRSPSTSIKRPLDVGSLAPFGVENYELTAEEEGGSPDTQAGSHPFQTTFTIELNQTSDAQPVAQAKDLHFKLPSGLVGNPTPIPQCKLSQFTEETCSPLTVIGAAMVTFNEPSALGLVTVTVPVFNLVPAYGEPARFGFAPTRETPVFIDTAIDTGGDYAVIGNVDNIPQTVGFLSSKVTFWGVPGDSRHDSARGYGCLAEARETSGSGAKCHPLEASQPAPFMVMPTSCTGQLQTSVEADSWLEPKPVGQGLVAAGAAMQATDGCNREPFSPSVKVTPDGTAGSTPTGLTVDEHVPQDSTLVGSGLAESAVKGLSVTLPEGVGLNPAAADGLQACSEEQMGLQNDQAPGCPEASKVATVKITTPLLPEPLEGAAYLADQEANPFGSLVALYVFAEDPVAGLRVKAAGELRENPVTGQLTAYFEYDPLFAESPIQAQFLPPLPAEDIGLHFFGGDRAPLATPSKCGAYTTTATIAPWSGNPPAESSSTFDVSSGPDGSPCRDPLLFEPELSAGSTNIQAGAFTPFTTTMSRQDGQQALQGITLHMPPGVSGLLSGVKLCGETEANAGTCGPESLIGETIVSVGVGADPYSVRGGRVYITGPYKGASFGLSIVNPAKAGPYDLGQVVVRAKLEVAPITAAITVTTDNTGPYRIPTILDGIPLQIKHVNVLINRPGFTFNPTNCDPQKITGTIASTEGASQTVSVPFQVTNCATLGFKPGFKVSTNGKTSRATGASLNVHLTYPKAPFGSQANIKSVKVDLPKQLPSNLKTLQKACVAAQFNANPAGCPAASIVGHATAVTPLIPVPLTGPAYFVSYGGAKFPELVIVLQGYGVTLNLHGETYINPHTNITSSTFHTVPDAPVGSFELSLPQGKYSALAANTNLCQVKGGLKMPTMFTAQNGTVIKQNTPITITGCPKKAHKKNKPHKKATHRKK